jgi:hypothetical protein
MNGQADIAQVSCNPTLSAEAKRVTKETQLRNITQLRV